MLGANLGLLLYGEVSVMSVIIRVKILCFDIHRVMKLVVVAKILHEAIESVKWLSKAAAKRFWKMVESQGKISEF